MLILVNTDSTSLYRTASEISLVGTAKDFGGDHKDPSLYCKLQTGCNTRC